MITQGWYESDGNTMYFYQCGFGMPLVVNHLSNYINMLCDVKTTVMLNANAPTFVCEAKVKAANNKTSAAEKERSRNASEKVDKDVSQAHNNDKSNNVKENEWKRTPTTKCMQKSNNKKCDEIKEKGAIAIDSVDCKKL